MYTKHVSRRWLRAAMLVPPVAAIAALSGCATFTDTASPALQAGTSMSGNVHGGQQPVSGSQVYLFAVGTSGYASASSSLLAANSPGVAVDVNGNGYVTTDSNGNFTIGGAGNFTCPSASTQVYLLASGGNPGLPGTVNNAAITLISAIGSCSNLTPSTTIAISELSTVAAVTALQQFMTDSTHIGSSSTNAAGIANAFLSVANIADLNGFTARTTNLLGNGSVPQAKLNTLANILAPCVNSASPSSASCTSLFTAATPAGGTTPTRVTQAMVNIAKNASSNVAGLFGQINASAPFQPSLASAPNDYTVGITYTGGGLANPGFLAIDAAGDAFTANCPSCNGAAGTDSIVGFGPQGAILTGATGFTNSIHLPQGIAFDSIGGLWSNNLNNGTQPDQVVRMTSSGVLTVGFPYSSNLLGKPLGIAIDSTSAAWVTNQTAGSVLRIAVNGTQGSNPTGAPGFAGPFGVGIDSGGFVFAAGTGSSSIIKLNPMGAVQSGPGAGFTGAGLAGPIGISIDNNDNIWTIDNQTNNLSVLNGVNGTAVTGASGAPIGLGQASIISIDGFGTGWIANCRSTCGVNNVQGPDNIVHTTVTGTVITTASGFQDARFATVGTTAIDASGNLWVSNNTGGSLTELLGVAGPVKTPLLGTTLGVRP